MTNIKETMIKIVLDLWNSRIKSADDLFDSLSDEQLQSEIAPGKNRGQYLLGHVTAVHDRMLLLLGFEEPLYPQLADPFLSKPDRAVAEIPSVQDLRLYWKTVNAKLATHFSNLKTDEWFQKHTAVSAEDFVKEPHRNKLNAVMGRATHLSYHQGQVALLKK